jgi:hypothetical protein
MRLLKNGILSLSCPFSADLAAIVKWDTANKYVTTSGSNISENYHSTAACIESVRKKITEYIEIDWKQKEKIVYYRTVASRLKKEAELFPQEFCLLDYFYWMRIKANYRDIDFLDFDNHVNEEDAYEYLTYYIKSANQYATALINAINTLKTMRGM